MNLDVGSIIGDYEVTGILGAGGMGKVYKVRNMISDRVEAMKVLLPDLAHEQDLADRFLREIKVQASLEHPNIASLHTAVRVDNQLLMLMEFVEGVTLEQKLAAGPLPPAQAVDYVMQALLALDYAHAHGVIHRDIKPANMLVTPAGVVKLMDFGIAKAAADRKLTMTGTTMGSLYYMSPEQIQGSATLDARSDLYSMGVALYELVTGKRPFDGDSQFSIMSSHLQGTPVPPLTLDPTLPRTLNDIILLSVAKDPSARFQTAGAFRNALTNVAPAAAQVTLPLPNNALPNKPLPNNAHENVPAASAKSPSRRGLWMGLGAVAALAVLVAAVALGPWKGSKAAPQVSVPAAMPAAIPAATPPAVSPPAAEPIPAAAPAQQPLAGQPPAIAQTPPQATPGKLIREASPVPAKNARPISQPPQSLSQPAQSQSSIPAPAVPQPAPTSHQPIAPTGPSRAELQQAREQLAMLGARATGIRATLQTMQRSQAASGLNLRGDIVQAATLMGSYLDGANDALNAADLTQAKSFTDKATIQVEKLEKFLNR